MELCMLLVWGFPNERTKEGVLNPLRGASNSAEPQPCHVHDSADGVGTNTVRSLQRFSVADFNLVIFFLNS